MNQDRVFVDHVVSFNYDESETFYKNRPIEYCPHLKSMEVDPVKKNFRHKTRINSADEVMYQSHQCIQVKSIIIFGHCIFCFALCMLEMFATIRELNPRKMGYMIILKENCWR